MPSAWLSFPAAVALFLPVSPRSAQDPLEGSLQRVVRALDGLPALERRIAERDAAAVADLLRRTEPAPSDPARDEALLESLRSEVILLEDLLASSEAIEPSADAEIRAGELALAAAADMDGAGPAPRGAEAPYATGLDDRERKLLGEQRERAVLPASGAQTPLAVNPLGPLSTKRSFEPPGFVADPVRLARALYKGSRYAEALELLSKDGAGAEAAFWRARCLERLGRTREALEVYDGLAASKEAGAFADRAVEDAEFLRWRLELERSRPAPPGGERP